MPLRIRTLLESVFFCVHSSKLNAHWFIYTASIKNRMRMFADDVKIWNVLRLDTDSYSLWEDLSSSFSSK